MTEGGELRNAFTRIIYTQTGKYYAVHQIYDGLDQVYSTLLDWNETTHEISALNTFLMEGVE